MAGGWSDSPAVRYGLTGGVIVIALWVFATDEKGGRTPEDTVEQLGAAIRRGDAAALYRLSTRDSQRSIETVYSAARLAMKVTPDSELDRMGLKEIQHLEDAEDALTEYSRQKRKRDPQLFQRLATFRFENTRVQPIGETRAAVATDATWEGERNPTKISMREEDGRWKIDSHKFVLDALHRYFDLSLRGP